MRNQFLPLAFLSLFSFIVSCTNNKPSVAGKWKPVEVDAKYIESYHMSNEDIKDIIEKESIEFTKDGKFISDSPRDTTHGIYNYNEKEKRLITAVPDGKTITFSIELEKTK